MGSSSLLPQCHPSLLPTSESCSSSNSNDRLWDEIDLAERYLVSSQFEEAAAFCLTILQKLRCQDLTSEPPRQVFQTADDDPESTELDDMIESAGMVLIQAYSETGRSGKIFENLEPVFGCVAEVPPSILLAGVCLQMSAGFFSDARKAIESFLQNWMPASLSGKAVFLKSAGKQNHGPVYLKPEIYLEVVEIYCIQLLAKGLKSPDLGLHFIMEADIAEDKKKTLIETLEKMCFLPDAKVGADSSRECNVTNGNPTTPHSESWATTLAAEAGGPVDDVLVKKTVHHEDESVLSRSVQIVSPAVLFLSKLITASSADCLPYPPRWHKLLAVVSKRRVVVSGAATLFLIYAIYRQRLSLRRLLKRFGLTLLALVHAIRMGFTDFWQLAFSLQLNPLAAVQPLPSQYVRM